MKTAFNISPLQGKSIVLYHIMQRHRSSVTNHRFLRIVADSLPTQPVSQVAHVCKGFGPAGTIWDSAQRCSYIQETGCVISSNLRHYVCVITHSSLLDLALADSVCFFDLFQVHLDGRPAIRPSPWRVAWLPPPGRDTGHQRSACGTSRSGTRTEASFRSPQDTPQHDRQQTQRDAGF